MKMVHSPKIIVLDDDPTGSQTVHSCLLLLCWDVETLCKGLVDSSPLLFILTNTRAHAAEDAARITREVCLNLKAAIAKIQSEKFGSSNFTYLIVSRSDSTLRGHYPLETDVITDELGPFDAQFLVPAFFEGGRITQNGVHYLQSQDQLVPVHKTEFAQDPIFGYQHSYLPDYIAEKTQGRVSAQEVLHFKRMGASSSYLEQLLDLEDHQYGVVDAVHPLDLNHFAQGILQASRQGKRFLFRSAASLLTALANLPLQPIAAPDMGQTVQSFEPGVFIVGSYVQKTTTQLMALLQLPRVEGIEVDLMYLQSHEGASQNLITDILERIHSIRRQGHTPVVYTSRQPLDFTTLSDRLNFGTFVAEQLAHIVHQLPANLGYLVFKGGMTSNIILTKGLNLSAVRLWGQIVPGCCLVQTAPNHAFSQLPVILFPGNVGQSQDLVRVYQRLTRNFTQTG